jgi:cytochrome P450
MMKQPIHTSGLFTPLLLLRDNPELFDCGVAYMDVWPISPPMLAVFHPDMMAQFTQDTSLPKHEMMRTEFTPFTGCNDLVNQEGQAWKMWRSIFNPGFSAKNLLTFVPEMVEEILVFKNWLKSVAASGEVVKLEAQAAKLTLDIIGRAVL